MWTVPFKSENSFRITLPFDLSSSGFFCRGDTGVLQAADCRFSWGSYRKHHFSSPVMLRLRNVGSSSALLIRSPQIVMRSSRWSCVRMRGTLYWVTRDMFRSSVRIICTYQSWLLLLLRGRLPIGSGWHTSTLKHLQFCVPFKPFVANQYAHYPPNSLFLAKNVGAT